MAVLPGFGITVPDYAPGAKFDGVNWSGIDSSASNPLWQQWAQDSGLAPQPQAQQQQSGPSAEDTYWAQKQAEEAAARARMQEGVAASVQAMFEQYGLGSLYPQILGWAQEGHSADAILMKLRGTSEYKARFPAMAALAAKGRAISEAAYIDYERTAGQLEQRWGLPNGMLSGHITDLLTEEVSAAELSDRVQMAVADSLQAPQDLRDTLAEYYNLDPDTALSAYYLDPDIALPLLEKQSQAARIGVWARRQGVGGVGSGLAEELQGLGITEDRAQQGFGTVAATREFGAGRGDVAGQSTRIDAALKGNADAQQAMERAGRARQGRFAGGGQFASDRQGVSGIGSSSS
jgi:hypothetical protein